MAIIKIGEDAPVISYVGEDGDEILCPKCGKKIVTVAIDSDKNTPICDCDEDQ